MCGVNIIPVTGERSIQGYRRQRRGIARLTRKRPRNHPFRGYEAFQAFSNFQTTPSDGMWPSKPLQPSLSENRVPSKFLQTALPRVWGLPNFLRQPLPRVWGQPPWVGIPDLSKQPLRGMFFPRVWGRGLFKQPLPRVGCSEARPAGPGKPQQPPEQKQFLGGNVF